MFPTRTEGMVGDRLVEKSASRLMFTCSGCSGARGSMSWAGTRDRAVIGSGAIGLEVVEGLWTGETD
jgi:hypothetical protein